jgi:ornithine cyclodeaminase/alanine dehydrogenase-like protein (mu-crystallin family)
MVGLGVPIKAIGADCPGKRELRWDTLLRADTFTENPPQTWIEGKIQVAWQLS